MAQWDRTIVKRCVVDQPKKRRRAFAVAAIPVEQNRSIGR
jgi:hypothetical protein